VNGAPRHFFNIIKQHGALLAKSRLVGVQFDALFTNGLYFDIARHADVMAMQLRRIFLDAGFTLRHSTTNQQFVVLEKEQMVQLKRTIGFETWEPLDDSHVLCRFVTSWATTEDELSALAAAIQSL
jgi:threonine aldolase